MPNRGRALVEEIERIFSDPVSNLLDGLQTEVAFSALDGSEIGAVEAELLSESLLANPDCEAIGPQVPSEGTLQIPFHSRKPSRHATFRSTDL